MIVKVGIFWAISGKVYPYIEERESIEPNEREKLSGITDSDFEHFTAWDFELAKKFPTADFATFPRGRVMFNIKENRHIVYADKCITNKEIKHVESLFQTIDAKILRDEHYRCDQCMQNK